MAQEIPDRANDDLPVKVIIAGAGLAGLLLSILLEKSGTPYHIFEKSSDVKPLGALMSLGANIVPIFRQLGLYEQLREISLPVYDFEFYSSKDLKHIGNLGGTDNYKLTGYPTVVFPRTRLYDLLLRQIPPNKMSFNKKVLSILQNKHGVMIRTSDNCHHHGDILVGADGAYSGVRQSLYKSLEESKKLSSSDKGSMAKGYLCLVGTTDPLDPGRYPTVLEPASHAFMVIGHDCPYSWSAFTVEGHRICWNVIVQQTLKESEETTFRNSHWGPDSPSLMVKDVRDFKIPYGTMGDLIDATPKHVISQVFLEDKLYETWHHGRTVLIGDACHKLLPSAGQGATNAMQDAVILANCIRDLETASVADIKACFEDYRAQRYPHVKKQHATSQLTAKLSYGHELHEKLLQKIILSWLPRWALKRGVFKDLEYQPQITFLPLIAPQGIVKILPQKPSKKGLVEQTATVAV